MTVLKEPVKPSSVIVEQYLSIRVTILMKNNDDTPGLQHLQVAPPYHRRPLVLELYHFLIGLANTVCRMVFTYLHTPRAYQICSKIIYSSEHLPSLQFNHLIFSIDQYYCLAVVHRSHVLPPGVGNVREGWNVDSLQIIYRRIPRRSSCLTDRSNVEFPGNHFTSGQ